MPKAANKTIATTASVSAFIAGVPDAARAADCRVLVAMMREATGEEPRMWGPSMIGFGHYHYKYDSGREGDMFVVGFASRKNDISIYIVPGFSQYTDLLTRLGKYKTGKVCLYVKRLSDIAPDVLRKLIQRSVDDMRARKG